MHKISVSTFWVRCDDRKVWQFEESRPFFLRRVCRLKKKSVQLLNEVANKQYLPTFDELLNITPPPFVETYNVSC